jgi:flagellar hook-associated protein 3 FlgL
MALTPYRPGSLTRTNSDLFVSMRRDMTSLQRQLTTGQRADTYGGLGFERRTSLDMRAKLSAIEGYNATIDQTTLRVKMMTQNLERLNALGQDTKSDMTLAKFDLLSDGTTFAQKNAEQRFKEVVDLLNADLAGRSLFAGRAVDKLPMESYDRIMNGDGARVGLKEMIRQRTLAELGGVPGTGMGRLTSAVAANAVTLSSENPVPAFGFRITGASATGASITAANAGGPPQTATFTVGTQPAAGDTITVNLTDADGNNFSVTLTASTTPPQAGALTTTFQIGAGVNGTAANLEAALEQAIKEKAATELQPRAAMKTAEAFFAATPSNLANLRVDGPPYESATGMIAGTAANTLIWYNGDADTAVSDRNTAPVRIDQGQVVATGARANEPAIRNILAQLGVLAASTFQDTKVDAERYRVTTEKVFDKLADKPGNPKVSDIATELANAAATMKAAQERHASTESMIYDALDGVEGVNKEEIAMTILDLQNRLQASYQTTSMLSQLSLVNYL